MSKRAAVESLVPRGAPKKQRKETKPQQQVVYYGSMKCQERKHSDGSACTNGAYYRQSGRYLCGVHSDKAKRQRLPKDKDEGRRKTEQYKAHMKYVYAEARKRQTKGVRGKLRCYQMRMMKEVPLVEGYLNVFPNNKHQNRSDGLGCASLSPMRLGPVHHRQPGLPVARNIENYHQFNKVWPNEVDKKGNPLPTHDVSKRTAYEDPVPHRHKYDTKQMAELRKSVNGQNRNQPLYSVHLSLTGEQRRFTYVQSRYFYCKAYEALAKQTADYEELRSLLEGGTNLVLCGYDAYDVTLPLYDHYCDPTRPFGHELVLYTLLTQSEPATYPWNQYREQHPTVYEGIAHVVV